MAGRETQRLSGEPRPRTLDERIKVERAPDGFLWLIFCRSRRTVRVSLNRGEVDYLHSLLGDHVRHPVTVTRIEPDSQPQLP